MNNSYSLVDIHVSIVTSLTLEVLMMFVCIAVCSIINLRLCRGFCHTMCGTCCGQCLDAPENPEACVSGQVLAGNLFGNPPVPRSVLQLKESSSLSLLASLAIPCCSSTLPCSLKTLILLNISSKENSKASGHSMTDRKMTQPLVYQETCEEIF